jgi:hypothetical protein
MFQRATKSQIKIRLALSGASGAGKTYSALAIASHLSKKIALIDTERGSASRYADIFKFDVCELNNHHPSKYIEAITAATDAGYEVIIIDSLTHAWFAQLELVDRARNSFTALQDTSWLKPGKDLAYQLRAWMGEVWLIWKGEQDAISWAASQLPDMNTEAIRCEFEKLSTTNGKKAPAWVERVMQLQQPF